MLSPLKEKYSAPIKLAEEKLEDLQSLRAYISNAGKTWLDELVVQQLSADQVENVYDVHEETTDPENMADDDALDDDSVPRVIFD